MKKILFAGLFERAADEALMFPTFPYTDQPPPPFLPPNPPPFPHSPSLFRSNSTINVCDHLWSAALPSEVTHLWQSGSPASTSSFFNPSPAVFHPPPCKFPQPGPARPLRPKGPRQRSRAIDPRRLQFTHGGGGGGAAGGSKVKAEWVK